MCQTTHCFSMCHNLQHLRELTSGGSSGYLSEKLTASLHMDMLMLSHSTTPLLLAVCAWAAVSRSENLGCKSQDAGEPIGWVSL